jgi:glycosyltransferase involved in cell wall biosynthesis
MTYYNRFLQLYTTLCSIQRYVEGIDVEIIIVDDASKEKLKSKNISKLFPNLRFNIIEVSSKSKNWMNPCIPYNMGLNAASGDLIIIQNPECFWVQNIFAACANKIDVGNYLTFSCYSLTETETKTLQTNLFNTKIPWSNQNWYNHPQHNPSCLHFCSCLTAIDLKIIKGFDPRFSSGYCWEDNEFLWRIKQSGISVFCEYNNMPHTYHQYHEKERCGCIPEWYKNKLLFEEIKSGKLAPFNKVERKK